MRKRYSILILIICASFLAKAQSGVVQLSGTLNSADTAHRAIPFATVYDLHTGVIDVSNYQGFFSIVVNEGDTVLFSCLGFKSKLYVVPGKIIQEKLSTALLLEPAYYIISRGPTIYPWGSRDQFPYAFVHDRIPDDDLARATRNLNPDVIRSMLANAPVDPNINSRMVLTNYAKSLYYYGQPQPISLLNPLAWAQFISDLKNGRYKNNNQDGYTPDNQPPAGSVPPGGQ